MINLDPGVTRFLDALHHPFREEIKQLRRLILDSRPALTESIKWNGPNYAWNRQDRLTMRIQPPKQVQLIFHRGAKKREQPPHRLIADPGKLLAWKETDRAVATFRQMPDIEDNREELANLVNDWIAATC